MNSNNQPADDVFVRLKCSICGAWHGRLLSAQMASWYKLNPQVWLCPIHDPVNKNPESKHTYRRLKYRG